MNASLFAPLTELATMLLPSESGADGAHDVSHLIRVWRNAKAIRLKEQGDLDRCADKSY